jgi:hypothetical protein
MCKITLKNSTVSALMPNGKYYLFDEIKSKLRIEKAKNLSNAEIERILSPCVAFAKLIYYAKLYRDNNILKKEDLFN